MPESVELRGRFGRVLSHFKDGAVLAVFHPAYGWGREDGKTVRVSGKVSPADLQAREVTLWGVFKQTTRGQVFRAREVWRGVTADAALPPLEGLERLIAEVVPGVGPAAARRLTEALGSRTWDAVTREPYVLAAHVGGLERAQQAQRAIQEVGVFKAAALAKLLSLGLSYRTAQRALAVLGADAFTLLEGDPYRLIGIPGFAFARVDAIARQRCGVAADDPRRLAALAVGVLEDAAQEGHTSLPLALAAERVERAGQVRALGVTPEEVLATSVAQGALVADRGDIYLARLHAAEVRAAVGMADLLTRPKSAVDVDPRTDPTLARYTDEQRAAIAMALREPVSLVYGYPGTGKTTCQLAMARKLAQLGIPVHLTATTGKAAARMTDALEEAAALDGGGVLALGVARTLHSLVGNEDPGRPLPEGYVFIDEWSMADLPLMARTMANCGPNTRLVCFGDPEQLPPVMPGNTARDLRAADPVPRTTLTRVHRQGQRSLIAINGARLRHNQVPLFYGDDLSAHSLRVAGIQDIDPQEVTRDCYFMHAATPAIGADKVVDAVRRLRDSRLGANGAGYDPIRDVQVYAPMIRGIFGTQNLNRRLQAAFNPHGEAVLPQETLRFPIATGPQATECRGVTPVAGDALEVQRGLSTLGLPSGSIVHVIAVSAAGDIVVAHGDREITVPVARTAGLRTAYAVELRVGDPVLQDHTDKRLGVVNGQRGVVAARRDDGGCVVEFDGVPVTYSRAQAVHLRLAYAITVHKGQGSGNKVAVLAMHHGEHYTLLDKSLFYVGLTRSIERFVYVGTPKALHIAMRRSYGLERHTRLPERIQDETAARAARLATGSVPLAQARIAAIMSAGRAADAEQGDMFAEHPDDRVRRALPPTAPSRLAGR